MSFSYANLIYEKISQLKSEDVFIATDFLEIADYETVRKTLNRLNSCEKIKKVLRGVYYKPPYSHLLGEYEEPSPHHVAMALARKFNWTIAPAGNTALNQLGLSTQVTAHWLYISDGPYNKFTFGNVELEFKHRSNKEISGMSYKTAMVIQAIKALGRNNIDDAVKLKLKNLLTSSEKKTLLKESQQTTAWVYSIIKTICEEE